jgi:hypothetical protein
MDRVARREGDQLAFAAVISSRAIRWSRGAIESISMYSSRA